MCLVPLSQNFGDPRPDAITVSTLAFATDGQLLFVGGGPHLLLSDGSIDVYDATTDPPTLKASLDTPNVNLATLPCGGDMPPRVRKEMALDELKQIKQEIKDGAPGVGRRDTAKYKLRKAIEFVEYSLDPEKWATTENGEIDPFRLNCEKGHLVFLKEKYAVDYIGKAIRYGQITNPDLRERLIAIAIKLAEVDQELAAVAIRDAEADPDVDPDLLAAAKQFFEYGNKYLELAKNTDSIYWKFKKLCTAIFKYKYAWLNTVAARPGVCPPDDCTQGENDDDDEGSSGQGNDDDDEGTSKTFFGSNNDDDDEGNDDDDEGGSGCPSEDDDDEGSSNDDDD